MNTTKKLAELIAKAKLSMRGENGLSSELARNMYIAENLIANGVTAQEWISVSENPPSDYRIGVMYDIEDTLLLLYSKTEWIVPGRYLGVQNGKHMFELYLGKYECEEISTDVTHWMPHPKEPKGE